MCRSGLESVFAVGAVLMAAGCSHSVARAPAPPPSPPPTTATAAPVGADPHIGAVFLGATDLHTCAAAVLHSAAGDLIVTAAHCLAGGFDATFVPGFNGDGGPAGTWRVDAVYMQRRWLDAQDPTADYAIARVKQDGTGGQGAPPAGGGERSDPGNNTGSLEHAVGGGLALGRTPRAGSVVTVTAYPLGAGGSPIGCRGTTGLTPDGFPLLRCAGFVDGTSGAPWVSDSAVVGVIGGLHGGGCANDVSYSAPFDASIGDLLRRAEAGGPGDSAPEVFEDDCE
jgi:hypothetical protein